MNNILMLTPPVEEIAIGKNRRIDFFTSVSDDQLLAYFFDQSISYYFENTLSHTSVRVVACYNAICGFFVTEDNPSGPVYTFDPLIDRNKLLQVADNLDKFYEIALRLQQDWAPFSNVEYLALNSNTKYVYRMFMQFVQENSPNSDPAFWEVFAFSELGIGLV